MYDITHIHIYIYKYGTLPHVFLKQKHLSHLTRTKTGWQTGNTIPGCLSLDIPSAARRRRWEGDTSCFGARIRLGRPTVRLTKTWRSSWCGNLPSCLTWWTWPKMAPKIKGLGRWTWFLESILLFLASFFWNLRSVISEVRQTWF